MLGATECALVGEEGELVGGGVVVAGGGDLEMYLDEVEFAVAVALLVQLGEPDVVLVAPAQAHLELRLELPSEHPPLAVLAAQHDLVPQSGVRGRRLLQLDEHSEVLLRLGLPFEQFGLALRGLVLGRTDALGVDFESQPQSFPGVDGVGVEGLGVPGAEILQDEGEVVEVGVDVVAERALSLHLALDLCDLHLGGRHLLQHFRQALAQQLVLLLDKLALGAIFEDLDPVLVVVVPLLNALLQPAQTALGVPQQFLELLGDLFLELG